jgi:hypothetical protein
MVEKILKLFNQKALIGIIISLGGVTGYFVWDKINTPVDTSNEQISVLSIELNTLKQAYILGQREYEAFKTSVYNNQTRQKNYTDKQIEFVVKNSDGKRKEMMLQVLELTKDKPEIVEYKSQIRVDTVYQTKIEKVIQEKTIFVKDSSEKKKGFLGKIFKK